MYTEVAREILSHIRGQRTIQAIKELRTVTFDGLKDCKEVIDRLKANIDSVLVGELAGYMAIRRMVNFHQAFGQYRDYHRDCETDRLIAIEHLTMVMPRAKAEGVIESLIILLQKSHDLQYRLMVQENGAYQVTIMPF